MLAGGKNYKQPVALARTLSQRLFLLGKILEETLCAKIIDLS